MNRQTNRQLGYSLAEVLVALAIFAVIFLAALTAYDRSNRVFKQGVESSNLQQNTRVAFDKLVSDVRMAGYDFDRDGIPTGQSAGGTNQYQQPDEQFEYIGPAAITVRSNYDYETENQPCGGAVTDNCDNGREKSLESSYFPVVTTGNDEIVTYALVPDSQTSIPACDPATNCVQFWADTSIPRKSYPDTGGVDEKVVEIPGVDLCTNGCTNPPYTLYRFTLDPTKTDFSGGNNVIRTPLASNIRSMAFLYYQDGQGQITLKDLNNVADESTGAAIKGIGKFQVASPSALIAEREIRGKVNSVRVTLTGMNETRDAAYTDTAETLTGGPAFIDQYRKYKLETLVAPRNVQKRGMREQDTFPPGQPSNLQICTGACNGVYMTWTAPPTGATYGAPDQYKIIYDLATASGYNCETTTFTNTYGYVFGITPGCQLQGGQAYKFAVVALNSYGSNSSAAVNATPINDTQPIAPMNPTATTTLNGQVTLTWNRPNANASGTYSCGPTVPNEAAELQGYIVEREDLANPGVWTNLPAGLPAGQVTVASATDPVTWTDTSAVNCINYRYQVQAVEYCAFNAAANTGGNAALGRSAWSVPADGNATTTIAPAQVSNLSVDQNSPCDPLTGLCNVKMSWPIVNTDATLPAPGNPITIDTYIVERELVSAGTWSVIATVTGGATSYIDANLPTSAGQTYMYRVSAHSKCPTPTGTNGAPSVARPYPCSFGPGILGSPLISAPSAFDGDGSAANPYKIGSGTSAVAAVNVLLPATIIRVVGRDYSPGGSLIWQRTLTAPNSATLPYYTFNWSIAPGATEQFNGTVVDTNGCVNQSFAFFEDEPQNCCLTPATFDSKVVGFSVPTTFVDFFLESVCSQQLTITGINFSVDPTKTPGGDKLLRVDFPAASGGCADSGGTTPYGPNCATYTFSASGVTLSGTSPISIAVPGANGPATLPSGITNVSTAASSPGTYKIRVYFSKSMSSAANQPVTSFTVNYTDTTTGALTPATCTVK